MSIALNYAKRLAATVKPFDACANVWHGGHGSEEWREAVADLKAMARDLQSICDEFAAEVDEAIYTITPQYMGADE